MMLTSRVINREALVLFSEKVGRRSRTLEGGSLHQMHVDAMIQHSDLELSLDKFSIRSIIPAVQALADAIPAGVLFLSEPMELPEGVVGAAVDCFRGIAMRTVIGERLEPVYSPGALEAMEDGGEMPDPVGYESRLIIRFDVRFQKPFEEKL